MYEINIFAEDFKKVFNTHGIDLPDSNINEITETSLRMADEFLLLKKYGRLAVRIAPKQFSSFEEIVKIGRFNNRYFEHLENNETCRKAIFAPITSTAEEELVLYWEGKDQVVPGSSDIYDYFKSKGFKVAKKAHPSLLVGAMRHLSEEKLAEIAIPLDVAVVLPTDETSLLPNASGSLCFLSAQRDNGKRKLGMSTFGYKWLEGYAFLLRRMKA
ncbi:MAG: hypothetical protein PHD25_06405 [Bacteroidales bacterium]|nr:hypothetical protein [Bacteroidales bacterium]